MGLVQHKLDHESNLLLNKLEREVTNPTYKPLAPFNF